MNMKTFLDKYHKRIYLQQTCTKKNTKGSSSEKRKMAPNVSTEMQKIIKTKETIIFSEYT